MSAGWLQHLPIMPVMLPLMAGALTLLLGQRRHRTRVVISLASTLAQLVVAVLLLRLAAGDLPLWPAGIAVYSAGGWVAPFGIVLVVDHLSALMVLITVILALAVLVYSRARWDRTGVHYHPLFQFLLMGLNGAFLTGDLFNLFVFFEVMLAASYGLVMHGAGAARVRAGLHYIAVNLAASLLFLVGAALVYGVTGTLNMADLARRFATLSGQDRALFDVGAGILGVVFLVKAGIWPLGFWLAPAYSAAAAPVAAMFSIMTKVGIYVVLRLGCLLAPAAPLPFAGDVPFFAGIATIAFGATGLLAARQMERAAAYCVVISAGTLLAAWGSGAALLAPLLLYLLSSVLATGAFFLLAGMVDRDNAAATEVHDVTYEAFGIEGPRHPREADDVIGFAIPGALAFLGLSFGVCTLLVSGTPPLSGFVAKFAMLRTALASAPADVLPAQVWTLLAALLLSGLAAMIALSRLGTRVFWAQAPAEPPKVRLLEAAPVVALLLLCFVLTVRAGTVLDFLDEAAGHLRTPAHYIGAVLPVADVSEGAP